MLYRERSERAWDLKGKKEKKRLKRRKKKIKRTIEILSNPELIHFGGDQYTLDKIEQRAKEQAIIDMWLDDMPYIDWSTCFDVQSIKEDFTDVIRMVEVDKKRFDNYNTDHLPF